MAKQIKWPKWLDYYEDHTKKAPTTSHTLKSKKRAQVKERIKKRYQKAIAALENASK